MQPVRGEHLLPSLLPHEREEIHPRRAGTFRLVAGDRIEPLDRASDDGHIAETGSRRGQRPVGLWQGDHARDGCVVADPLVDRAKLLAIAILALATDDVVRPDEQRHERWAERRDERQLRLDEIVGRVPVHGGVRENDLPAAVIPNARQDRRKRAIRRRSRPNGERVTERKESFGNAQVF